MAARRARQAPFERWARPSHAMRVKPYVLKLSSWNTLYCDIVAEGHSRTTPWILSLRDPIEASVSLLAQPPGWMRDTAEASRGLASARRSRWRLEITRGVRRARTSAPSVTAAMRIDVRGGRLVPYESLPAAVWDVVAPAFLAVDGFHGTRRHGASGTGKCKGAARKAMEFVSDVATKQAAASPGACRAIEALARPHLERLRTLHAVQCDREHLDR